jgi:general nucleoside transport system permease protein
MLGLLFSASTLVAAFHIATPLLLAAIGGSICYKTGVFNIALEGLMLLGAFSGVVSAYYLHSAYLGVLVAGLVGLLVALIFGLFHLSLGANEIITGLGINMFASGLTTWLLIAVWNTPSTFIQIGTPSLPEINIPFVENIPIIGPLLSTHNLIDFGALLFAVLGYIFMNRSVIGLQMRAVGELPEAAKTSGISILRRRYLAVAISGVLCAIGGAHMSLAHLSLFSESMTSGRGFIAFAAVIFSSGNILVAAIVSLLFGFTGSIAIRLEGYGVPSQFIQMIPYAFTIVILLLSVFRTRRKTHLKVAKVEA